MMRRSVILALCLISLTACQPAFVAGNQAGSVRITDGRAQQIILSGRVTLPHGFAAKATSADILDRATVTLLDATGNAVAAGTTDATGAFTLYKSTTPFNPADGTCYTLEVLKRYTGGGTNNLLALRTIVQRLAGAWSSITGSTIRINLTTTTVARIQDESAGGINAAAVIGSVGGVDFDTVAPAAPVTADAVSSRLTRLTADLTDGRDPLGDRTLVWQGDYTISDAATAAAFANIEEISGTLNIDSDLVNLSLPKLRYVGGKLLIGDDLAGTGNASLQTIDFSRLTSIGNYLTIANNPQLQDLRSLKQLTRIGGSLRVQAPLPLPVNGSFTLMNNGALTSLQGLDNLKVMTGKLEIKNNANLASISALSGVRGALDNMWIWINPRLANLDGLSGITASAKKVYIEDNDVMTNLDGLSGLTSVGDHLYISNLAQLANINGLSHITSVGTDLTVQTCPLITNLDGLRGLSTSPGRVSISTLAALTNTDGLLGMTRVGAFMVMQCNGLTDLAGLANLTRIDNDLQIADCSGLSNLSGLGRLQTIGTDFAVGNCSGMTDLTGMPLVTTIGGYVNIVQNNNAAFSLNGLQGITSIGGMLSVDGNAHLENLTGLNGVTGIGGTLNIANNPDLTDLSTLRAGLAPMPNPIRVDTNNAACPTGTNWPL